MAERISAASSRKRFGMEINMDAYTDFAQVYDEFMDETPYEEWCEFLAGRIEKYGIGDAAGCDDEIKNDKCVIKDRSVIKEQEKQTLRQERNTILDLGCGTGTLTELLACKGYDMIGVDNAQEMLQIAMDKRERSGSDILYLLQDMREFELYGAVGAVISVCDSINYLLEEEEILQTFRLVYNYLYPGGVFIFDFNTVYKYASVIGDATIAENRENCSFIWENYYHEEEEINEYDLTIFARSEGEERFLRFQETHYQRGYCLEQMRGLVEEAGLTVVETLDADTHDAVIPESERIYVVAKKI